MTATDRLYGEMGALAAAFAWSRDSLMALEHAERRRWVLEAMAHTERLRPAAVAPQEWP